MAPDLMSDTWLREKLNGLSLMQGLENWFNKGHRLKDNNSRLFLLSKDGTNNPPIQKIRPIDIQSPIKKVKENVINRLDSSHTWDLIGNY